MFYSLSHREGGAGEMDGAQRVMCFLCKHEDLTLDPLAPTHTETGMVAPSWNPSAEMETG